MTCGWVKQGHEREGGFKDNIIISVWATSAWWCNSHKCGERKLGGKNELIFFFVNKTFYSKIISCLMKSCKNDTKKLLDVLFSLFLSLYTDVHRQIDDK